MEAQKKALLNPTNKQLSLDLGPQSVDFKFMRKLEKVIDRMRGASYRLRGAQVALTADYSYLNAATLKAVAFKYNLDISQNRASWDGIGWKCTLRETDGGRKMTIYFSTERIEIDLELKMGGLVWEGKI